MFYLPMEWVPISEIKHCPWRVFLTDMVYTVHTVRQQLVLELALDQQLWL
jgi:hypothetical protein